MVGFMKMLFFIGSLTLMVRVFLVFCYGLCKPPTLGEGFRDERSEHYEHDQPMIERPLSQDFDIGTAEASLQTGAALLFKKAALGVTVCEGIVMSALAVSLFTIAHQHLQMFS